MRYRRVCLVAGSVALAACGSIVDPERRVELSVRRAEFSPLGDSAVVRTNTSGNLEVNGRITTPDPCRELDARATVATGTIELTITSRGAAQVCAAVVAAFPYMATLPELHPGTYRVRVLHAHAGTGWPTRVVADTSISVP